MDSISEEYGVDQAATGPARPEPVVSVRGLVKRYGSHEAVAGIDFEVRRGEIFAFLGPNGAGKTTTVEILEGFRQPTEGQVSVLGHDPATAGGAWRDRVGVVLQESEPEPGLSVRECLGMYAGFYRAPRDIDETIALVGLTGKAGALGTRLSGGQRRRLHRSPDPSRTMLHARNSRGNARGPENGIPLRHLRHLAGRRPAPPIPLPRMRSSHPGRLSLWQARNARAVRDPWARVESHVGKPDPTRHERALAVTVAGRRSGAGCW